MMLTTKGRYAVMAMVDLAMQEMHTPVPVSDVAVRQAVAQSYLEQLFSKLRRHQLVKSVRGPGGGYQLTRAPHEVTVADIIKAVDESLKTTRCDQKAGKVCHPGGLPCKTHHLWEGLERHVWNYFKSISLADICENRVHSQHAYLP